MKIILLMLFTINLWSMDLLQYKSDAIKKELNDAWIEKTYWLHTLSKQNNTQIIKVLKNYIEYESSKRAMMKSDDLFVQLQELAYLTSKYDVMLFDVLKDKKLKKLIKQEILLCNMYLSNYIPIEEFYKRFLNIATTIKRYGKTNNQDIILLFDNSIKKTFKMFKRIEKNTTIKLLTEEELLIEIKR